MSDHRGRLIRFYTKYAPEKLENVDRALAAYAGREDKMFEMLVAKYGAEPVAPPAAGGDDHRARLVRFYTKYAPEKVENVDRALATYAGREDKMFEALVGKYGPEPGAAGSRSPPQQQKQQKDTPRAKLTRYFQKYAPDRMASIDGMLQKYAGKEAEMFKLLEDKFGPDPAAPPPQLQQQNDTPRAKLTRYFKKYAPDKLNSVDAMLQKYAGKEGEMFQLLQQKFGPDPGAPAAAEATKKHAVAPQRAADTPRAKLTRYFRKYAPDKMASVEPMLQKYDGKEGEMFQLLEKKFGPDPGVDNDDSDTETETETTASDSDSQGGLFSYKKHVVSQCGEESTQKLLSILAGTPQQFALAVGTMYGAYVEHVAKQHDDSNNETQEKGEKGEEQEQGGAVVDVKAEDLQSAYPKQLEDMDKLALQFILRFERTVRRDEAVACAQIVEEERKHRAGFMSAAAEDNQRIERLKAQRESYQRLVVTKALEMIHEVERKLRTKLEESYRLEFLGIVRWFETQRAKIVSASGPSELEEIDDRFQRWKQLVHHNEEDLRVWSQHKRAERNRPRHKAVNMVSQALANVSIEMPEQSFSWSASPSSSTQQRGRHHHTTSNTTHMDHVKDYGTARSPHFPSSSSSLTPHRRHHHPQQQQQYSPSPNRALYSSYDTNRNHSSNSYNHNSAEEHNEEEPHVAAMMHGIHEERWNKFQPQVPQWVGYVHIDKSLVKLPPPPNLTTTTAAPFSFQPEIEARVEQQLSRSPPRALSPRTPRRKTS